MGVASAQTQNVEFDARLEEYVEMEEHEDGLIHAIEEERNEEKL